MLTGDTNDMGTAICIYAARYATHAVFCHLAFPMVDHVAPHKDQQVGLMLCQISVQVFLME